MAWIAAIAAIIAAVVVTVTLAMPSKAKPAAAVASLVDAGPPPPPPLDGPPPPPVPTVEIVKVRIETKPSGATLSEGGRDLGVSPREIPFPLSGETVSLIASYSDGKNDWESECKVRPAIDRDQTVSCKLKKLKQGQPRRKPNPGSGSNAGSSPGTGSAEPGNTANGELEGNPLLRKQAP